MGAGHGHDHGGNDFGRAFAVGIALNGGLVILQLVYGLLSHSLALVADAGHNLSDVLGLVLAWGASRLARRRPTERHTYGWRSSSILAALLNALLLFVGVGAVGWEAVRSFGAAHTVTPGPMMWVAAVAIVVNLGSAVPFLRGRKRDLNIRAAVMHLLSDAAVSVGVLIAGVVILKTGWMWVDPLVSLVISVVILVGTWGVLKDAAHLALGAVPETVQLKEVREYLGSLPGVDDVHDLHVWALSTTESALTAHLVLKGASEFPGDEFIAAASKDLHDRYDIQHATLQLERGGLVDCCKLAAKAESASEHEGHHH